MRTMLLQVGGRASEIARWQPHWIMKAPPGYVLYPNDSCLSPNCSLPTPPGKDIFSGKSTCTKKKKNTIISVNRMQVIPLHSWVSGISEASITKTTKTASF